MVRVTSALFPMDSTLCIIKPDAMRLGYKQNICHMIHMFGFNVIAEATFKLTRVRAEQFYRAHSQMPYFETLIRFMISRSIHCMVLVKDNCCRAFRALLGPKDSNRARREAPQTIRALYGTDGRMNAVHGSDTVKEAEWEIKFFFPTVILEPYPSSQDAASYFKEHVQPLLLKGLTALAKAKPASEPNAAVVSL
uniref:Nucleoside diphosphate kinase-like domain-containing protein n=2 Tax=Physcomitrium patens TaxID=3218 RepID=A0A2K1ICY2_PHYPA|nr:hypothetical protein PHYPA_030615 [Physcomitrium patens]